MLVACTAKARVQCDRVLQCYSVLHVLTQSLEEGAHYRDSHHVSGDPHVAGWQGVWVGSLHAARVFAAGLHEPWPQEV